MVMKNNLKVMFYIKRKSLARDGKAPIMMRVTLHGERAQLSTRLTVNPAAWNHLRNRVMGRSPEAQQINERLEQLRCDMEACYDRLRRRHPEVTAVQVRDSFRADEQPHRTLLQGVRYQKELVERHIGIDRSQSTYYRYHSVEKHLQAFLRSAYGAEDMLLEELDDTFLTAFRGYLSRACNHSKNTVWVYMTTLKHILMEARLGSQRIERLFARHKLHCEFTERNYLTIEEMKRLVELDCLALHLRLVRDAFLFSCFTGLSFVDLKGLRGRDIRQVAHTSWIETTRHKTGTRIQVRLFDVPHAILLQYMPIHTDEVVFRLPSNGWCNRCLAQLMAMAEIDKHVTFHCARHTFATTLTLSQGMPIETISKLLGHTNIRTTQIYATVTHDYLNLQLDRLSKRIDALCADWKGVATDEKGALVAQ